MTVKEFKRRLSEFPDDWEVQFDAGSVDFYRLKDRGGFVNVESNQQFARGEDGVLRVTTDAGRHQPPTKA